MRSVFLCLLAASALFLSCQQEITEMLNTSPAQLQLIGAPNACSNATASGLFKKAVALTNLNKVSVGVNVSTTGQWKASTNTVNGLSFSGSGNLVSTGNQTIVLEGTGTPLQAGNFSFVLTVGSSQCSFSLAVDTSSGSSSNIPPIAVAGADHSISLPTSTVTLNGTGTDADGSVTSYQWTKLSGPTSYTIASPNQASTQVTNLVQGAYLFELRVTDNLGATGRDTVSVSVTATAGGTGTFASEFKIWGTITPVGYQALYDASGKIVRLTSSYFAEQSISYNSSGKIQTIGWWYSSGGPQLSLLERDSLVYNTGGEVTSIIHKDLLSGQSYTKVTYEYNSNNTLRARKIYFESGAIMDDNAFIYTNGNITGFINNASNPQRGDTVVVTYDNRINHFKGIYPQMYFLDIQTTTDQTDRSEIYFFSNNYPTSFGPDPINVSTNTAGKPFEIRYLGDVWYRYGYN